MEHKGCFDTWWPGVESIRGQRGTGGWDLEQSPRLEQVCCLFQEDWSRGAGEAPWDFLEGGSRVALPSPPPPGSSVLGNRPSGDSSWVLRVWVGGVGTGYLRGVSK